MTQIAALAARPAVRRITQQLVSRLALALLLAFLGTVLPGAVKAVIEDGPWAGVTAFCTLTEWLASGFWLAVTGG
jgi:hypothetical protein